MNRRRDAAELEDGCRSYIDTLQRAAAADDPEAEFCEGFSCALDFARTGDLAARVEAWLYFRLAREAERDNTDLADRIRAAAAEFQQGGE